MTTLPEVEGVEFRLIDGFTAYAVGGDGSVWSKYLYGSRLGSMGQWRPLSLYRRPVGGRYVVVCLRTNNGKGPVTCRYVHRLVLEAFVGPCPDGHQACHGDRDTSNNRLTNLRWGTYRENHEDKVKHGTHLTGTDAPGSRLTLEDLCAVFFLAAAGVRHLDIAEAVGSNQSTVSDVLRGRRYIHETITPRLVMDRLKSQGLL